MTDFVLEQEQNYANVTRCVKKNPFLLVVDYAKFMKQPLKLGMFFPCGDRYQNILQHPDRMRFEQEKDYEIYEQTYREALERVLFKDFIYLQTIGDQWELEHQKGNGLTILKPTDNVEFMTYLEFNVELTESAIKQIGI